MGHGFGTLRSLLSWLALVSLLSACQSTPAPKTPLPPKSSLLALTVVFPAPLSRDPALVQAFFVKGPIHAGLDELPEFIPATFVKSDRAYLLDPEPGTYSVVAVTSAYAPPWNDHAVVGVTQTTWSGTSSDAVILPAQLIHRTRTTVGPGRVAFIGTLRVRPGERIDAKTEFEDDLQRRVAETLRPGVTSKSGLAGWLERSRLVELQASSLSNEVADRRTFFDAASADLGSSAWAEFVARAATAEEAPAVAATAPAPGTKRPSPPPQAVAAKSPPLAREAEAAPPMQPAATDEPKLVSAALPTRHPEPAAAATDPERRRFPGLPPDSRLSQIEFGMSHGEVREILGAPDDRIDRLTAKAWIPFYMGPGANLRDWIYAGQGRVVFSLYHGKLEVIDVIYDPDAGQ